MKKRILYITNGICGAGGLERVLSIKASCLAEEYLYQIHILTLNEPENHPFYDFSAKIIFHNIEVGTNIFQYVNKYKKGIQSIIKKIEPQLISVCDDGLKGLLFPIIFGKKIPLIYERHVSKLIELKNDDVGVIEQIRSRMKFVLMNWGGAKFDKFVVLTNGNLKEWPLKNLHIIPNPLPFKNTITSTRSNKKILCVGKQSFQKGYDRLLKIWKRVSPKHPDWQLEIYGKIEPSLRLDKQVKDLGLAKTIHFFPPIKDIQSKYQEASIYLMTSRFEGFGMVLIEAMSYGIPCISFDCPHGPADIIKNNIDGYLIPNNDIDTFSNQLALLIEDTTLRNNIGENAKQNVRRFSADSIVKQWDDLFKSVILPSA